MRDNFERFGGFTSLDMIKMETNTLLQLYIALSMRNELEQVCIETEGIVAMERAEAYQFLINFIIHNTLNRKKDDVYVLSGDVFSQAMIHS